MRSSVFFTALATFFSMPVLVRTQYTSYYIDGSCWAREAWRTEWPLVKPLVKDMIQRLNSRSDFDFERIVHNYFGVDHDDEDIDQEEYLFVVSSESTFQRYPYG
jgi:hypothetical protein